MDTNLDSEVRLWQEKLFARAIRRKNKFERIKQILGSLMNLQCLEISSGDGVISAKLRTLGGSWKTAAASADAANSAAYCLNDSVTLLEGGKLPFEDTTFDRVVIVDALKDIANDYDFLHECHRVLKNDGWVIISETRRVTFSLVALLQKISGLAPVANGKFRNGYKISELFGNLKDGFDVPETICYSNGLFESVATIWDIIVRTPCWMIRGAVAQNELYRYRRLYGISGAAYPLLWLLSKFEFLPGHRLLFKSRRRHWRPRLQPKLIDGRSIAEAAINTKIGTAAPF